MRYIHMWVAPVVGVCLGLAGSAQAGSRNASHAVASLVRAGAADWNASCASGKQLCVQTKAFRHHLRCTGGGVHYRVMTRTARSARGLKRLRRAMAAYRRAGRGAGVELARAAAPAFLLVADSDHERFLRTRFPRHLTFDPRDTIGRNFSVIRFQRWVGQLTANVSHLAAAYREAAAVAKLGKRADIERKAKQQMAAVLARAGELLETARIPKSMAKSLRFAREMTAAYCDEMAKQAKPLLAGATRLVRSRRVRGYP